MTVPRTAADVLDDHVTFELECIDRLYLNLYQPKLQHELGVVGFFKGHRGFQFVSSALMDPITKTFVTAIHRYVNDHDIPLVDFRPGERKDDIAQRYLAGHDGAEGILFVGRAQEKTSAFRTEKRRNPQTGATFPWLVRRSAMVNHFYFYGFDADFGPFFIKFATYFPYNAKVCLNGHHYAQQQAHAAGIAFQALDNGFVSADDPARLQRICDDLDHERIDTFCRKWLKALPHPFSPADRTAGYRYDISILQAEFSRTQVLDRPLAGRVFFEEVIRDNLDAGRPDRVSLIFARHIIKTTPGRFRTRVLHNGVQPSLHIDYKHSKIKQYHKLNRALRTETTINDTRDFGIGKRLHNLPALREVGFLANRRLLATQRISRDPTRGDDVYGQVCRPTTVGDQRVAGLRLDTLRTQMLLSALVMFRLLPGGFTNHDLRQLLAPLLGLDPSALTCGQMTYDLRRLRLHGLIQRIPTTHRYQVTDRGLQAAISLGAAWRKLVREPLGDLTDAWPSPLRRAYNQLHRQLEAYTAA
jgi:hypothetical protein